MKIALTSWMLRKGLSDLQESVGQQLATQALNTEFLHFNCKAPMDFPALTELCANTWPWGKALVCSPCFEASLGICKAAPGALWYILCSFGSVAVQGVHEGKWSKGSFICSQVPSFVFEWVFKNNFQFFKINFRTCWEVYPLSGTHPSTF